MYFINESQPHNNPQIMQTVESSATDLEEGEEEDSPIELWSDTEWSKFVGLTNWAGVGINVYIPNPNPAGGGGGAETVNSNHQGK